jgi:hypothetical protein
VEIAERRLASGAALALINISCFEPNEIGIRLREHMSAPIVKNDKATISYLVLWSLLFLLFASRGELDRALHLELYLIPILLVPGIAIPVAWLTSLIVNIFRWYWKSVASILAAPFLAYLLCWALAAAGIDPPRVRFELNKPFYLRQIAELPNTGASIFRFFDWGETGGPTISTGLYTLIYDESDQISLAPEQRSRDWQHRVGSLCPGTRMCSILDPEMPREIEIRKMADHFYLVSDFY